MITTLFLFIVILGLLVFVHELGHFLAAKRYGVTVHEFAFGFRPRLVSWRRGETEYAINLLPFGGYVRLEGESRDSGKPGSFTGKPIGARSVILVGGVVMNVVLAWVALTLAYAIGSLPLTSSFASHPLTTVDVVTQISRVEPESPAAMAGLKPGMVLAGISGLNPGTASAAVETFKAHVGEPIDLDVWDGSKIVKVVVVPRVSPPPGQGPLGVQLLDRSHAYASWYAAPVVAALETLSMVKQTLVGLGALFRDLVVHGRISDDVSGIVGVGAATGAVRQLGIGPVLQFVALISVNLALINLVPIPPLDGGQLVLTLVEKMKKRAVEAARGWLTVTGLALILLFAAAVTIRDIVRFDIFHRLF